jgi:hypothetical protein
VIILITLAAGFAAMFLGQVLGGVLLATVAVTSPLVDLAGGEAPRRGNRR